MKITECPRDAMQGIEKFIPTQRKIDYLNSLLAVGFDVLDFGSFVSPKAIPQLADTSEVLKGLNLAHTQTKLLAIVANVRGAEEACIHKEISFLGFPFSVSETFQQRNTNKSLAEAFDNVKEIQELSVKHSKKLVVYISMGFGNPYGDEWTPEIVIKWAKKLAEIGVETIALSDTVGIANKATIKPLFETLIPALPSVDFTAHFHTTPDTWHEKVKAAYDSGCRGFDGAIKGFGGCPMAKDDLTGNMPTEKLITFMAAEKIESKINVLAFESAYNEALKTFPTH
ncbi:MAG: hydroxymethylglutaryl-CoA lyase [Flavobacteriales bacterium]|jgi:hydroxymethylglutaryl-CoA lyase